MASTNHPSGNPLGDDGTTEPNDVDDSGVTNSWEAKDSDEALDQTSADLVDGAADETVDISADETLDDLNSDDDYGHGQVGPQEPTESGGATVIPSGFTPSTSKALIPTSNGSDGTTSITVSTELNPAKKKFLRTGIKIAGWVLLAGLLGLGWWLGSPEQQAAIGPTTTTTPLLPQVSDDFQRSGPVALDGISGEAIQWTRIGEPFVAENGAATVADGDGSNSIALIQTSAANARIEAEVGWATAGTGIVYRYQDESNYWSLVSAFEFGTWNLTLTTDGEIVRSWPTGISELEPGTRIAVDAQDAETRVFINGELMLTVLDDTLVEASGAGIIAKSGTQGAISEFSVTPHNEP